MKGMKGKLLKKLNTVKAMEYLKPETVLQMGIVQGYVKRHLYKPKAILHAPFAVIQEQQEKLEDPEMEFDDKENRCDLNVNATVKEEGKLLESNLPAESEEGIVEIRAFGRSRNGVEEPLPKARKVELQLEQIQRRLREFPEKCPPGGRESIILYTTSLRGIRKTFEDCQKVRSLLENMKVVFIVRDISMHSEFRQELWEILETKEFPPKLFIKGRYIGGAEEVLNLHEQGNFRLLIEGIPLDRNDGECEACAGFKFIICFNCCGSRKVSPAQGDGGTVICGECNENGLLICPFCC